ncbi:hypothetical protein VTK73DRAFT_8403 [Phialemonium thermophilum]|uniref:Uncharacterized protein n=1 Tax=Phialemonium thermophilum TaxID=223376 RepID=A0ABR3W9H1_9PEZI
MDSLPRENKATDAIYRKRQSYEETPPSLPPSVASSDLWTSRKQRKSQRSSEQSGQKATGRRAWGPLSICPVSVLDLEAKLRAGVQRDPRLAVKTWHSPCVSDNSAFGSPTFVSPLLATKWLRRSTG